MNGRTTLYDSIKDNSTITALLTVATYVSADSIMPGSWPVGSKAINFYMTGIADMGIEYGQYEYTVNCRASTEYNALTIAQTVADELNREKITGGGRYYCKVLPVLIPADNADDFNVPVEVTIKTNQDLP